MPATTGQPPSSPTSERAEELPDFFTTLEAGTTLPSEQACAERILATPSEEVRPENTPANGTTVSASIVVDGAGEAWNERNASRVTGNFVGTTDQILRWASCKWGFDEDITRARAVTESSWRVSTEGDVTENADACALIGLDAPCPQSYGLLQVKGTVHEGTYPASATSSAFGVDYALAWLRACFEGEFTWFESADYAPGEEWGCVGAWFSGLWWDQSAIRYIGEVQSHLAERSWTAYS